MIWILLAFGLIYMTTWHSFNGTDFSLEIIVNLGNLMCFNLTHLTNQMNMAHCINCHIIIRSTQQYVYNAVSLGLEILSILEEWIACEMNDEDVICQECFDLLLIEMNNRIDGNIGVQRYGHQSVCISCGISVNRRSGRRSYPLVEGRPETTLIIAENNLHQVPENARTCNACWQRAHNSVQHSRSQPVPQVVAVSGSRSASDTISASVSEPVSASISEIDIGRPENENRLIYLDGYQRTPDTSIHCFVPDCHHDERLRVPIYLKIDILNKHKIYVTPHSRVCEEHIACYNWDFLTNYEFTSDFSLNHISEMLDLLRKQSSPNIDFEKAENIDNHVFKYWTGLTVINFFAILNCVNQLAGIIWCRKPKTALGLYLMRLRTGEPIRRIASIVAMSRSLTCNYIKKARNSLMQHYVPLHLGIDHINRESLSSKNLLLPKGLFGTPENNPIVICDGTYVYMQKSSNYLFQKKSYSLHKYTNLVKPFLFVASDGYIIDIFGPYAATTSDATIMRQLFENNINSTVREYFRENDVFLLDRGFRDAIEVLHSLGYKVYKPESRSQGEIQLSTEKANKSRLVTLCRWVVEVVNGRFKRDWKIFRYKYFNIASRNLIHDFKIAGAIMNNFHPVLTDRPDAQSILDRVRGRMDMPNYLGDYILQHQLNRHRANFVQINAEIPQLDMFPTMNMSDLILFALGIYQIKQARSYYGEHIRQNGTFIVEISNEINPINVPGILSQTVLIRGRIKSRHQSNKVYFTYILINTHGTSWQDQIKDYYCSCIIGKRTVGSCAHIMTIVWYLGWARHQINSFPPAQFLDNIFVREDIENE